MTKDVEMRSILIQMSALKDAVDVGIISIGTYNALVNALAELAAERGSNG